MTCGERETLANGLIVLLDERPTAGSVALHLMARAGSRDDSPALGITALTSRLMFQGTRRRPSETALHGGRPGGRDPGPRHGGQIERVRLPDAGARSGTGFDLLADLVSTP